tara:strand:- start:1052 stop:2443 length:1392 start_codon:yes stop_codon:yes gene_type:complete
MAGKSAAIFSVSIGTAVSEGGDPELTTLLPQPNIPTYKGYAVETGATDSFNFEEATHSAEFSRSTPGEQTLVAIGLMNTSGVEKFGTPDGQMFRAGYPDEISVSHRFRGCKGESPTNEAWGKILGSSMGLHSPTAGEVILADNSADTISLIILDVDADKMPVGSPFRMQRAGELVDEYSIVTGATDLGDGTFKLDIHPGMSLIPAVGQKVNPCYAFYPVVGDGVALNDFTAKFDMGGLGTDATVRTMACGSRCTGFTLSNSEGAAAIELSFRPLVALQDDANANVVESEESDGAVFQHRYGTRVDLCADHRLSSAPFGEARTYLPNLDHTIAVEFDVAPGTPETRSLMRGATQEVHNATCKVTLQTERDSDLQKMIVKDEIRTLILGFGPTGEFGQEGGAFILKNGARDTGSAGVTAGDGNRIEQETVLRAVSDFSGCNTAGLDAEGIRLATAPFLFVLPRKA